MMEKYSYIYLRTIKITCTIYWLARNGFSAFVDFNYYYSIFHSSRKKNTTRKELPFSITGYLLAQLKKNSGLREIKWTLRLPEKIKIFQRAKISHRESYTLEILNLIIRPCVSGRQTALSQFLHLLSPFSPFSPTQKNPLWCLNCAHNNWRKVV